MSCGITLELSHRAGTSSIHKIGFDAKFSKIVTVSGAVSWQDSCFGSHCNRQAIIVM